MWKDFFYFPKSDRRVLLFLLASLCVLVNVWIFFPELELKEENMNKEQEAVGEIEKFLAGIHELEQKKHMYPVRVKSGRKVAVLTPFDPNLADSIEFLALGLPPFIAGNIVRYRKAGGRFRSAEDFSRIYGLSSGQFGVLKPYIRISETGVQRKDTVLRCMEEVKKDSNMIFFKYQEGTVIDLNEADTTELKKIPGIGSGIACTIVAYRERLGGFYSVSQLREVRYVKEDLIKWFKLGNTPVHRINANKAGLDRLRSHPYMNFYQAKVIVEYRRKKGKLKSLSQLALYEEFTEKDLERLSHYLAFD